MLLESKLNSQSPLPQQQQQQPQGENPDQQQQQQQQHQQIEWMIDIRIIYLSIYWLLMTLIYIV